MATNNPLKEELLDQAQRNGTPAMWIIRFKPSSPGTRRAVKRMKKLTIAGLAGVSDQFHRGRGARSLPG